MKKAWTLAELTVAIILVVLISAFAVHIFKPNTQKSRIFAYAMLKNMNKGNSAVMEKYGDVALEEEEGATEDWYCTHFSDMVAVDGRVECDKKSNKDVVNMKFSNGITLQGMANEWKTPYEGAEYSMKNVVIDINGESGPNKVWIDRFPIRVLKGKKYTGLVRIVDCSDDMVYNTSDEKLTLTDETGKSPYCRQGFKADGANVTAGISKKSNVVTYDVYRAVSSEAGSKAILVASNIPAMEADCQAYGGDGEYNAKVCALNNYKIAYRCATSKFCDTCQDVDPKSICPVDPDNNDVQTTGEKCKDVAALYNNSDCQCFTLLHKPSTAMTILLDHIIGEISM